MRSIPRYSIYETRVRRDLMKYYPAFIGNYRPEPSRFNAALSRLVCSEVRDVVDSETVLMRTLPRGSFRDFTHQPVALPHDVAVSLENFEKELTLAGFKSPEQKLVRIGNSGAHFRVEKAVVSVERRHKGNSVKVLDPQRSQENLNRPKTVSATYFRPARPRF